jgi:hypothetical protein
MKTKLLLPALLAVAMVSSGCVVAARPAYGVGYGYGYTNYGYGYGPGYYQRPGVYVNRPGVYVSRPAARVVVRPGYGRVNRGPPPGNFHGARPVGGRGHR